MKISTLFKLSSKSFSSNHKFTSKKVYFRSIREMDKFNRVPKYKFDTASNLYDEANGLGEFDRSNTEDYIKRKQDEKQDRLDLAKRQLNIEKQMIEERLRSNIELENVKNAMKITEKLLNRQNVHKGLSDHPELETKRNETGDFLKNKTGVVKEYGNYEKYFIVDKVVEPGSKNTKTKEIYNLTANKRLDNLKEKYNIKNKKAESEVLLRDRRFADRINKDMQRDDLTFTYADYLKMSTLEGNMKDTELEAALKNENINYEQSVEELRRFKPEANDGLPRLKNRKGQLLCGDERGLFPVEYPNGYVGILNNEFAVDQYNELELDALSLNLGKIRSILSFEAREDLYQRYLDGTSLQDLSLKYGILPETAKELVCERYIYWNMIFPKIGPLRHRKLIAAAERNPQLRFLDYGLDLQELANREYDVPLKFYKYSKIPEDLKPLIAKWFTFEKIRQRQDRIPVKFVGTGSKGYLIIEDFVKKGKAAKKVCNLFSRYLSSKDSRPGSLPLKVLRRKSLGPRYACFGHTMIV